MGLALAMGFGAGMAAEKKRPPVKKQAQYNPKELGVDKASKWEGPDYDASKNRQAQPKKKRVKQ